MVTSWEKTLQEINWMRSGEGDTPRKHQSVLFTVIRKIHHSMHVYE